MRIGGDSHSSEPVTATIERNMEAFASPVPPWVRQLAETARTSGGPAVGANGEVVSTLAMMRCTRFVIAAAPE